MDMNFGPEKMDCEYFEARKINRVQNDGHWPYRPYLLGGSST